MDGMDEIVREFLVESYENLDQLDRDLVALEQEPGSRDLLSSIFRTIHTIKGTSGFLAFSRLETLTHAGENLLSRLRDGEQQLSPESADALLRMVDTVRALLDSIEHSGAEGEVDVAPVVEVVTACIQDAPAAPAETAPHAEAAPKPEPEPEPEPEPAPESEPEAAPEPEPEPVAEAETAPAAPSSGASSRSLADTSIRVDVDLLDSLMRLVGELVLTRNQLVRHASAQSDVALLGASQRLNLITSELQEGVMKTRMQPIDQLWSKLPRVVRDLSHACGKQVRVAMQGRDTELDRSLLEAVKDPLTHLVRNAVDHGVETPEKREAAGKPVEGTLTLRAYHEGGHVIVEVSDDGAGIDPEKVAAKALDRGLVSRDQLAHLSRQELLGLLFLPGFSTAETITNVSGRGVGMDVVKTNIEKIGGAVDVESTPGVGTTWRLTIPLTLAIIQSLTVECAGERYAIPQVGVHELVCVDEHADQPIEEVSGAPVYRLRGKLLPLVHLSTALGLSDGPTRQHPETYIAVLQADGRRFGLVVDRVLNTEEIVVKPLSSRLKEIGLYAGAAVLGDGRVALILDVQALARHSLLPDGGERAAGDFETDRVADRARLLLATVGNRRIAIPLQMVTRLEEFGLDTVERVGSREVVQYRGSMLPLVRLHRVLDEPAPLAGEDAATLPVVVYSEGGRSVALAVDRIVDIVEDSVDIRADLVDIGLTGSAVVQDKVTEMLDMTSAILAADPAFYEQSDVTVSSAAGV